MWEMLVNTDSSSPSSRGLHPGLGIGGWCVGLRFLADECMDGGNRGLLRAVVLLCLLGCRLDDVVQDFPIPSLDGMGSSWVWVLPTGGVQLN